MQKINIGRRGMIVGFLVLLALAAGAWFFFNQAFPTSPFSKLTSAGPTIAAPVLSEDLAQTALITPKDGGVIRAIDADGVVSILRVPAGAVAEEVEVTLTPFESSAEGLHRGTQVLPADVEFLKPVTLSFNWHLAKDKAYQQRPYVLSFSPETKVVTLNPTQRALVVKNFMPALITTGGMYGLTDDKALAMAAAKEVLVSDSDTLMTLDAGLTLQANDELTRGELTMLEEIADAVMAESEPSLDELYLSIALVEGMDDVVGLIPTAHAYGLTDGYLQFRCNLPETTYEDAMIAMSAAARLGYTEVEDTCRKKAEKLLIDRANLVDRQTNRPLIDAVEVLQQMQAIGLTDAGSPGAAVAERLHNDVLASLNQLHPGSVDVEEGGRVRENRASTDPLLKHNSTVVEEMIGIQAGRFIGMDSFDEAGIKNMGETMYNQVSGLNMIADTMCDLDEIMPFFREAGEAFGGIEEFDKRCKVVEDGTVMQAMDMWRDEVGELAEGVDATQRGETPNSNWNDTSDLERFIDQNLPQ